MKSYYELIEGVYDPNIFKAIFLAGGPGSGKSFIVKKTMSGSGMRIVNSDDIYEYLLDKAGLDAGDPNDIFSDEGQAIRKVAKGKTKTKQTNFIDGRLGMIIDGTGKDFTKIARQAAQLKQLGYDVSMVFVNTSLDVAQERNMQRKRKLDPKEVEKMWKEVQANIGAFQRFFGQKDFIIVDNNVKDEDMLAKIWKMVAKKVRSKPENPIAKQWIARELEKKKRK